MNLRKLFLLLMVAVLCLGRPAFSQEGIKVGNGATAQVVRGGSPVVKVTDADGKILASIPIEMNPGAFVYSKSSNTIYVIHTEKNANIL